MYLIGKTNPTCIEFQCWQNATIVNLKSCLDISLCFFFKNVESSQLGRHIPQPQHNISESDSSWINGD